jgi:hypothetical protein
MEFKYKYNVMIFTLMNTLHPGTAPLTYVSCVNIIIIMIGPTGLGIMLVGIAGSERTLLPLDHMDMNHLPPSFLVLSKSSTILSNTFCLCS